MLSNPHLFTANTLEAAKFYDDQGKLVVIDGDKDETTVTYNIGKAFDDMFFTKNAGAQPVGMSVFSFCSGLFVLIHYQTTKF